ncbi:MAG: hypothetical protein IPL21_01360 [Saprospirales bacterium]|nr:hypothetical protein [Saprospirales bacterium]
MSVNPPFTSWKIYINGELDTTFTQATLPATFTHRLKMVAVVLNQKIVLHLMQTSFRLK